jgi:hypothetical protein
MAISKKRTLCAVVEESTSGTPLDPSSGADYVTLQDDFSMSPNFDRVPDAELNASGVNKPDMLGEEQPAGSISHYLRTSGVEATAPIYGRLLKAAFGQVVAAASEYATASGSTAGTATVRGILKLASGGGAAGQRGKAYLIKDTTNGYSIRNAYSISGDDISLSFNLAAAPASGINTGRSIIYQTSYDKPSLSMHLYRGNGGAHDVMSGVKVSRFEANIEATQAINSKFDLVGLAYYLNPIRIGTARYLDFYDGVAVRSVAMTQMLYKSPHDAAEALQTLMNAAGSSDTFTVKYNSRGASAGKFTISTSGATLELRWASGPNTANTVGTVLGWVVSSNDTGATSYTSDNVQVWAADHTPSSDSDTSKLIVKSNELMIGDFSEYTCAGAASAVVSIENEQIDVEDLCADTGIEEKFENARTSQLQAVLNLKQHEAKNWYNYHKEQVVSVAFNGGPKVGGNWVAGKCVNIYMPRAKIIDFNIGDEEVVKVNMTLQAYVEGASETSEAYLNLL